MPSRYDHDDRESIGFTAGLLTGAAIGAGLALWFAPKAGVELRADLGESLTHLRDAVSQRYQQLAEQAGVQIDNLRARAEDAAARIEDSAREAIEEAEGAARSRTRRS